MKLARMSLMMGTVFFIVCGQSVLCSDRRGRRREHSTSTPRSLSVPPSPRSKEEVLRLALSLAHEETSRLQDQMRYLQEQNKDMDQRFQEVVENGKISLALAGTLVRDSTLLLQTNLTLAHQNAALIEQNKALFEMLASMCPDNTTQR